MPLSLLRYVNVPFSHHDFVPVQELVRTGLVVGGTSCSFRLWADAAVMKPQQALFAARVWIPDVTHQPGEPVAVTAEGPEASGGLHIPSSAINGHLFWIRLWELSQKRRESALPGTNYPSITQEVLTRSHLEPIQRLLWLRGA